MSGEKIRKILSVPVIALIIILLPPILQAFLMDGMESNMLTFTGFILAIISLGVLILSIPSIVYFWIISPSNSNDIFSPAFIGNHILFWLGMLALVWSTRLVQYLPMLVGSILSVATPKKPPTVEELRAEREARAAEELLREATQKAEAAKQEFGGQSEESIREETHRNELAAKLEKAKIMREKLRAQINARKNARR